MKLVKYLAFSAGLAVIVLYWLNIRLARSELRILRASLQQQNRRLVTAAAENEQLRNAHARAAALSPLSESQLSELLALRNEVRQLRRATNDVVRIQKEMERIHAAIEAIKQNPDAEASAAGALISDELPIREARVARFQAWLADRPEEVIPEIRFLPEGYLLRSASWDMVTDEELEGWAAAQRSNAGGRFNSMTYKAVKLYAAENGGRFPTDLSMLKPYYETPVDDTILNRWEIVPAKSLSFIDNNWHGGDWVITQKSPINKRFDSREAIGLGDALGTVRKGRWDPPMQAPPGVPR